MTIRPADLLFVSGTSLIDRGIEDITHAEFSHVAIFTSPTELYEAQFGRTIGPQDPHIYAYHSVVYTCPFLTDQQRNRIVRYAKREEGEHYDVGLIAVEWVRYTFGILLPWHEYHSRICSTFGAGLYRETGIDVCPKIKWPSPGDLSRSPFFVPAGKYE